MNLSIVESRLKHRLPEEHHQAIEEEISKFEIETAGMSPDDDKIGQARLTDSEIRRLPMGNQHTKWNVIKWQVVKAAAIEYAVRDWTSKIDRSLTYTENVNLMEQYGTSKTSVTMKQLKQ